MNLTPDSNALQLPQELREQLLDYRRRVWTIKMTEAIAAAAFGVLAAWLTVFLMDRVFDTPAWLRGVAFLAAWAAFSVTPLFFHRWVWRRRRLEELALLLSAKAPAVGDQLLGVIELTADDREQQRSRELCEAAIRQVAADASRRDLKGALPDSRYPLWCGLAAMAVVALLGLAVVCPAAIGNAWARFSAPWRDTPRYTFAAVKPLPDTIIAPHGEPFPLQVDLLPDSRWNPSQAKAVVSGQRPVTAELGESSYQLDLPPQIDSHSLNIRVGDYSQSVKLQPEMRPELTSLMAEVQLPDYLQLTEPRSVDARGGVASLVRGSRVRFVATANRELAEAAVNGAPAPGLADDAFETDEVLVDDAKTLTLTWRDQLGLAGGEPFDLEVAAADDEAPSLICEDLPRRRVVLDTEQLAFRVRVSDDFGVREIGMRWDGIPEAVNGDPAQGERILAAGAPDRVTLEAPGSFNASNLGIEPQPIQLRIYAEDYLPGRERVYSAPYLLYVLNAEQHAIWMTEQLNKWRRQSLEVRDREMQLLATNKQLRDLSPEELDRPDNRRRLESQAAAERANGRRLASLTQAGEQLIVQASRNPEIGVGHLEKWAEMLQILKDIADSRMPSVADLLSEASKAEPSSGKSPSKQDPAPSVGQNRAPSAAGDEGQEDGDEKKPAVPSISDSESSQQPQEKSKGGDEGEKPSGGAPRLTLPTTTLMGAGKGGDACPAGEKLDQAIKQQEDLLAEFQKVADELNAILGNLEGSTLVKRLKAASREQDQVAVRIGEFLGDAFGRPAPRIPNKTRELFTQLADVEKRGSGKLSIIMDDLQAYFERRRLAQFRTVLEDMKESDVVGNLRQLSIDLPGEQGLTMAQCEYWSDTMDRWAEDLVDPASGGT